MGGAEGQASLFRLFLSASKTLASVVDGKLDPAFAYQVGCRPPHAFGDMWSTGRSVLEPPGKEQGSEIQIKNTNG